MRIPGILVVTGASGSGKTTTVRALEARALFGVHCYYFDAVGVPRADVLERDLGSPEGWQAMTTRAWLDRLAADPDSAPTSTCSTARPDPRLSAARLSGLTRLSFESSY